MRYVSVLEQRSKENEEKEEEKEEEKMVQNQLLQPILSRSSVGSLGDAFRMGTHSPCQGILPLPQNGGSTSRVHLSLMDVPYFGEEWRELLVLQTEGKHLL